MLAVIASISLSHMPYIGAAYISKDKFDLKVLDKNLSVIGGCSIKPSFLNPNNADWKSIHNVNNRMSLAFRIDTTHKRIFVLRLTKTKPGPGAMNKGWSSDIMISTFGFDGMERKTISLTIDWECRYYLGNEDGNAVLIKQSENRSFRIFRKSKWISVLESQLPISFRKEQVTRPRLEALVKFVPEWKAEGNLSLPIYFNNNPRWVLTNLEPLADLGASFGSFKTTSNVKVGALGVYSRYRIVAEWKGKIFNFVAREGESFEYVHLLERGKIVYSQEVNGFGSTFRDYWIDWVRPFTLGECRIVDLSSGKSKTIQGASYCFPII